MHYFNDIKLPEGLSQLVDESLSCELTKGSFVFYELLQVTTTTIFKY